MQVLAHPKEKLVLEITDKDTKIGISYKHLMRGSHEHEELVNFWNTIYSNGDIRRTAERQLEVSDISEVDRQRQQAVIDSCTQASTRFMREVIKTSISPYVTNTALNLIEDNISREEYRRLLTLAVDRFPSYYPLLQVYHNRKWPERTEESKRNNMILRSAERNRIMLKPIGMSKPNSLKIGDKMELTLVDSVGKETPVSSFAGKFVLIEVWASWCAPCIMAMPNIVHAQKRFVDSFVCCAITIDKDDRAWRRSISKEHLQSLLHFKATDDKGELRGDAKQLIPQGTIPQNYLLDRDGKIIAINIYGEDLIKKLEELTKK